MQESHKYDDIIHLQRPISGKRARMSMIDRGAQFSPFAALVGYDAVIQETARYTDAETELDESSKELLDRSLRYFLDHPSETADFFCFRPDEKKDGGSYIVVTGSLKKVDMIQQTVILDDGTEIPIERIRNIESVKKNGEEQN